MFARLNELDGEGCRALIADKHLKGLQRRYCLCRSSAEKDVVHDLDEMWLGDVIVEVKKFSAVISNSISGFRSTLGLLAPQIPAYRTPGEQRSKQPWIWKDTCCHEQVTSFTTTRYAVASKVRTSQNNHGLLRVSGLVSPSDSFQRLSNPRVCRSMASS